MSHPALRPTAAWMIAFSGLTLLPTPMSQAAPLELYVAASGDDAADGRTPRQAFATLARARDEVRRYRRDNALADGALVHVASGVYVLAETLAFGPEDAGTELSPVVFEGEGARKPVLRGGPTVTGFEPYKGSILRCDLQASGLGDIVFGQLFFKGRRMPLARTPNVDPEDIHGGTWAHALGGFGPDPRCQFRYGSDVDGSRWARPQTGRVCVFCRFDWRWNRLPVEAVDPVRRTITMARRATYDIHPGDRYYVEGIFEELDAPGEWFLDREKSLLYFWPPSAMGPDAVSVAGVDRLIEVEKSAWVVFRGFVLENGEGTAVTMADSRHCRVEAAVIRNTGGWGVSVNGGESCAVVGCDLSGTGHGGVMLSGGDRATLTPAKHVAENNVIHDVGVFERTYNTGVNIGGVGNAVRHCLIFDTPHAGMTLSGNENLIEFNHIHHTNLQSADTGGLYSCPRDWTQRGNVIRYNRWHDIGGFGKKNSWNPVQDGVVPFEYPHYTWGVYMDDPTSGNTIYGNILYRVPICAFQNHGGRDNTFENNIIVDCPAFGAGVLSSTWTEWENVYARFRAVTGPGSPYLERYPALRNYKDDHPEEMSGLRFVRNIVYYTVEGTAWLRTYRGWGNRQQLYRYRVREQDMSKNEFDHNLIRVPEGLELSVSLQRTPGVAGELTWEQWQKLGMDTHSVLADPRFVDASNLDFRLQDDSPALALGFKPIPVAKIGPYKDPLRATWPLTARSIAAAQAVPIRREIEIYEPTPARPHALRQGIGNVVAKLARGEAVRVAYYGGGIHYADGWRKTFIEWLRGRYPRSTVNEVDAGICDCVRGSGFSVYRYDHDVLDHEPDLVLVDFASDDHQTAPPSIQRSIEGIVRQTWRRSPTTDLLFLYAFRAGFEAAYAKGRAPMAVAAYETLADHYGIAAVNMGYAIAQRHEAGTLALKGEAADGQVLFSPGGVRPTPEANGIYADALCQAFAEFAAASKPSARVLPEPFAVDNAEHARLMAVTEAMVEGEWRQLPESDPLWSRCRRHFDAIWFTETPGASLTFTFRGTSASLFHLMGPDTGRVRISVDGKQVGDRQHVDRWCYYQRLGGLELTGNLTAGEHTVRVELLPDVPDRMVAIEEAKKLARYEPGMFEGTRLRIGWIRVLGRPPRT